MTALPFEILRLMLERPGEVIARRDLELRLWPDGTFVDFDHSLNSAIRRLRVTLGDSAVDQRFVETIPGRGYRFRGERAWRLWPAGPWRRVGMVVAAILTWVLVFLTLYSAVTLTYTPEGGTGSSPGQWDARSWSIPSEMSPAHRAHNSVRRMPVAKSIAGA